MLPLLPIELTTSKSCGKFLRPGLGMFCFVGGKEGICRTWLSSLRKLELVEDRIPMIYDRNDNVYIIYVYTAYIYICVLYIYITIQHPIKLPLMICPPEF
jgi:hypothetical protein